MRRRHLLASALALLFAAHPGVVSAQPEAAPPEDGDEPPPGAATEEETEAEDDGGEEKTSAEESRPATADELGKKPPKGKGALWGTIVDTLTGKPVADAPIEVVGTEYAGVTDSEGRYRIELPPGRYTLRVWSASHEPIRARGVVVWAGGVRRIDAELSPADERVEEFVVEVDVTDGSSVEALTLKRQKSAAAGDTMGRAEMSKTPASNAAQAAQRVVGATIEGSRFVFVRGLGGRYTNALLNGAPLPSPEPDRAAVPLDLFPTGVLESLTIVKTFTPDVPGDFAGGSVRIVTRRAPDKFLFQASASSSFNTNTTFQQRLDHRGSGTDWLGFDNGLRSRPKTLPTEYPLAAGVERPDGTVVDAEELTARGIDLNTFMSETSAFSPPSPSFGVVVGDGFDLGKDRRIGYLATLNHKITFKRRDEVRRVFEPDPTDPSGLSIVNDVRVETGSQDVVWGTFGNVQYDFSKDHKVSLIGFHSQLADRDTQTFDGFWQRNDATLHATRLRFVSRALNVAQLHGEHVFDKLGKGRLDWNGSYSVATRSEPDTRDVVYQLNPNRGAFVFVDGSESGRHFFSSQNERAVTGGFDWTQPVLEGPKATSIKLGGAMSLKDREFEARRFAFRRNPGGNTDPLLCDGITYQSTCPDRLFVPDNIGDALALQENTFPEDSYTADLDVFALYFMGDISLTERLRLVMGERVEVTNQTVDPFDQFDTGAIIQGADLSSTDLLPSLGLIYSATEKAKLRASVARTIARPQLRELAPFAFSDFFGGDLTSGNPELELTRITNIDTRFEYYPTLSEVLAFSVFYKKFEDPIETVVTPSGDSDLVIFQNAEGAQLIGVELEARVGLGNISKAAEDFGLVTNLTLAESRIQLEQTDRDFLTNVSRRMIKQPPYVFNFAIDYASEDLGMKGRVLYNIAGKRLVEVGADGLDDTFEHPRHQVDATIAKDAGKHFEVKLTATNILDSAVVQTIGPAKRPDRVIRRYRDGQTFKVGAKYTF